MKNTIIQPIVWPIADKRSCWKATATAIMSTPESAIGQRDHDPAPKGVEQAPEKTGPRKLLSANGRMYQPTAPGLTE